MLIFRFWRSLMSNLDSRSGAGSGHWPRATPWPLAMDVWGSLGKPRAPNRLGSSPAPAPTSLLAIPHPQGKSYGGNKSTYKKLRFFCTKCEFGVARFKSQLTC